MPEPSFTIQMVTVDCRDPGALAAFWSAASGCPVVAELDGFVMVGSTPVLGFQQVDSPTPGKNRVHLDVSGPDRESLVARLRDLGATEHETRSVPGLTWTTMSDPEGNVFCVGDPEPGGS